MEPLGGGGLPDVSYSTNGLVSGSSNPHRDVLGNAPRRSQARSAGRSVSECAMSVAILVREYRGGELDNEK